jgi:beta-N-acetylhexosaminidase
VVQPIFFGLAGTALTTDERALFTAHPPAGFILFKRNIVNHAQVTALTDRLRDISGRVDVPTLIDQEGGRVARMQPPEWPAFPAGAAFDALYEKAPMTAIEAARVNAQALGLMLTEVGINVNCLPLLDVRQPGAHDIIGDRALGSEPLRVAALGRAVIEGLAASRCVGVVKHMPGHGRAMADSHMELPIVEAPTEELETDLAPFITLNWAPMAMTAHVVYTAWDSDHCATLSRKIVREVIRERIGFNGLLMSDDLGMKALAGDSSAKARGVLAAGVDIILHCSGDFTEMQMVSEAAGDISDASAKRLEQAMATIAVPAKPASLADLIDKRDQLLALA